MLCRDFVHGSDPQPVFLKQRCDYWIPKIQHVKGTCTDVSFFFFIFFLSFCFFCFCHTLRFFFYVWFLFFLLQAFILEKLFIDTLFGTPPIYTLFVHYSLGYFGHFLSSTNSLSSSTLFSLGEHMPFTIISPPPCPPATTTVKTLHFSLYLPMAWSDISFSLLPRFSKCCRFWFSIHHGYI